MIFFFVSLPPPRPKATVPPRPVDFVTVESRQNPQHALEMAIRLTRQAAGLTIRCVPDAAAEHFWRIQITAGNREQLLQALQMLPGVTVVQEVVAEDVLADEEPFPPDGVKVEIDD